LTVNTKTLDITADSTSKTYGSTVTFAGTEFTTGSGQLVNGNSVTSVTMTSSGAAATATVAGSPYSIVPSAAVGSGLGNYAISYHDGLLTVTQKAITVTADAQSKAFGASDPALTYQITNGSLVSGDSFSGALTRESGEAVGTYAILQDSLTAGGNYNLTYVGANLTITAGEASAYKITADNSSAAILTPGVGKLITITLVDASGNTVPEGGDRILAFSGLLPAADGTQPTLESLPITNSVTLTFSNGEATTTLVAYKGQTNVLDVAEGSLSSTSTGGAGLTVVLANASPVAGDATYARAPLTSLKINILNLLTNVTDLNKDHITLTSVTNAPGGAALATNSTYIFYTPNGVTGTDSFTYTVSDGNGGTDTATVTINVVPQGGIAKTITVTGTQSVSVKFYGIPGIQYDVQKSTDLGDPNGWQTLNLTPISPEADGSFGINDTLTGNGYYRSIQH
jgi:hypothetical protein